MKPRFLMDPPPGFRGLDPNKNIERYERNLPHWRQEGATYFVTFRLIDSLPQSKLNELKSMREAFRQQLNLAKEKAGGLLPTSEADKLWAKFSKQCMTKTERWLDQGMGDCDLKVAENRKVVTDAIDFFDGERHEVGAFVIMPNHVHAVVRPFAGFRLERNLQSIKRESSRKINRRMGKSGPLWQEESHDRIVRDAEHLAKCVQYIGSNPRNANLKDGEAYRWISKTWKEHGWDFVAPE